MYGASKERARLQTRVECWWQSVDNEQELDDSSNIGEPGEEEATNYNDHDGPFIDRHGENERSQAIKKSLTQTMFASGTDFYLLCRGSRNLQTSRSCPGCA